MLKARQRDLDRIVVVKLFWLVGEHAVEGSRRFLQEARILAELQHPRIVGLLDYGAEDGCLYLTSPHEEGRSLGESVDLRRPSPPERVSRLLDQVLEGLDAMHARGLVHRDLKPGNLLVLEDGSVKILDFGLARDLSSSEHLTGTGVFLGTPLYLAPDQALAQRPDPRDDLYSLGVIAYELLVGSHPFRCATLPEVLERHLHHSPPPVGTLRPEVPAPLAALVDVLLAKSREARPDSAARARAMLVSGGHESVATRRLELDPEVRPRPPPPAPGRVPVQPALVVAGLVLLVLVGMLPGPAEAPPAPAGGAPPAPLPSATPDLVRLLRLGRPGGDPEARVRLLAAPEPVASPAALPRAILDRLRRDRWSLPRELRRGWIERGLAALRALEAHRAGLEEQVRRRDGGAAAVLASLTLAHRLASRDLDAARLVRQASYEEAGKLAVEGWLEPLVLEVEVAAWAAGSALRAGRPAAARAGVLLLDALEASSLAFASRLRRLEPDEALGPLPEGPPGALARALWLRLVRHGRAVTHEGRGAGADPLEAALQGALAAGAPPWTAERARALLVDRGAAGEASGGEPPGG